MKRQGFLVTVFLLALFCPFIALADLLGTGDMKIAYSTPVISGYYGDYDIYDYTYISGKKIDFASWETFCISKNPLDNKYQPFGFYSATEKLAGNANLITWIANWAITATSYSTYDTADKVKGLGQGAIWQILGVIDGVNYIDIFKNNSASGLFDIASNQGEYINQWLVAVNPVGSQIGESGNQDYLVKASPVPEPATMLLLGTGLAGLAGSRLRRKKM